MGWVFIQSGSEILTGFPDTLCLAPNGYHCFVEWKRSRTAKKQALQDYWNKRLNDMGHDTFFVSPENVNEWRQEVLANAGL